MSWYCKNDALNDIAQVSGTSVKDLDEQFIVFGEQPPPVVTTNEEVDDDELLLRYGGLESNLPVDKGHNPDLAGITEMLRMVEKFQIPLNDRNKQKEVKDSGDTIITISKLNPSVPDFIPRNTLVSESCELDKTGITVADTDSSCIEDKYEKTENISERFNDAGLKEISDKLKEKISSPSVETCLQKKTEKNLAIASLLKLYSNKPANGEITDKKLKLLTPQHFEKTINDSQTSSQNLLKQEDTRNMKEDTKDNNDTLMEESVLKVQNWFDKKEKETPKEPALYLGPIIFKKKEYIKPAEKITPSSVNSDKVHKKVGSFVPSEYANKLTETYMVRNKTRDDQNGNIWTKLERELKAKDEIIREKMKLQGKNVHQ